MALTGELAFPFVYEDDKNYDPGISKRDYIALNILNGILSSGLVTNTQDIIKESFIGADLFIQESKKEA